MSDDTDNDEKRVATRKRADRPCLRVGFWLYFQNRCVVCDPWYGISASILLAFWALRNLLIMLHIIRIQKENHCHHHKEPGNHIRRAIDNKLSHRVIGDQREQGGDHQ